LYKKPIMSITPGEQPSLQSNVFWRVDDPKYCVLDYLRGDGNDPDLALDIENDYEIIGPVDFPLSFLQNLPGLENQPEETDDTDRGVEELKDFIRDGWLPTPLIVGNMLNVDNYFDVVHGLNAALAIRQLGASSYPAYICLSRD
jgi:hypothetical protein